MDSILSQMRRWLEFLPMSLSVFTEENGHPLPEFRERVLEDESLKDIEITEESIYQMFMKLKEDKACCQDELHPKLLKQ